MSLRYFAISTLLLATLVVLLECLAAAAVPDIGASIQRDQQRGDPELRDFDLAKWTLMALVGNTIAASLAIAFIVSSLGLLRRRSWARRLFLASSLGVVTFMIASCIRHLDTANVLRVIYGLALFLFGWWFLFRSQASTAFSVDLDATE